MRFLGPWILAMLSAAFAQAHAPAPQALNPQRLREALQSWSGQGYIVFTLDPSLRIDPTRELRLGGIPVGPENYRYNPQTNTLLVFSNPALTQRLQRPNLPQDVQELRRLFSLSQPAWPQQAQRSYAPQPYPAERIFALDQPLDFLAAQLRSSRAQQAGQPADAPRAIAFLVAAGEASGFQRAAQAAYANLVTVAPPERLSDPDPISGADFCQGYRIVRGTVPPGVRGDSVAAATLRIQPEKYIYAAGVEVWETFPDAEFVTGAQKPRPWDGKFEYINVLASLTTGKPASFSTASKGERASQLEEAIRSYKYRDGGAGVRIAIVDTGVSTLDASSQPIPEMPNVSQETFLTRGGTAYSDLYAATVPAGHGTPIAWLLRRIAPLAVLASLQACNEKGKCVDNDVLNSVCRAISSASKKSGQYQLVLNLSLASRFEGSFAANALSRILSDASKEGVLVAAAAGPGSVGRGPGAYYPAAHDRAIGGLVGVGSAELPLGTGRYHYVPRPGVDFYAPGRYVLARGADGQLWGVAGSSFATAQVSAALALLRSRYPAATAAQLEACLREKSRTAVQNLYSLSLPNLQCSNLKP